MSNQIPTTPLITFYEYKNCYFAIHRMISKFFKDNWSEPYLTVNDINSVVDRLKQGAEPVEVEKVLSEQFGTDLKGAAKETANCLI